MKPSLYLRGHRFPAVSAWVVSVSWFKGDAVLGRGSSSYPGHEGWGVGRAGGTLEGTVRWMRVGEDNLPAPQGSPGGA